MCMQTKKTPYMIVNREVRNIPLDWQHPIDTSGQPIPLLSLEHLYTPKELQELLAAGQRLADITSRYMPDFSALPDAQLGLCVYETTTEGTPLTPVFPATPEGRWALVHYCATRVSVFGGRRANAEAWAELLFGGSAVLDLAHDRLLFNLDKGVAA
jgi:hypothetical protein